MDSSSHDRCSLKLRGFKIKVLLTNSENNFRWIFRKSFNIPKLILHRYLRTTTVYTFIILFVVSAMKFTGEGPLWKDTMERFSQPCREHWWTGLLHIQNYYNPLVMVCVLQAVDMFFFNIFYIFHNFWKLVNPKCLQSSWYISADFQLVRNVLQFKIPLWITFFFKSFWLHHSWCSPFKSGSGKLFGSFMYTLFQFLF